MGKNKMILWNSKCGGNETGIGAYELQIGGIDQGHFTVCIEFVVQFEETKYIWIIKRYSRYTFLKKK